MTIENTAQVAGETVRAAAITTASTAATVVAVTGNVLFSFAKGLLAGKHEEVAPQPEVVVEVEAPSTKRYARK